MPDDPETGRDDMNPTNRLSLPGRLTARQRYRRSDEETAFLLQWAEALGATPEEARTKLAEMDTSSPPTSPQRP